MSTLFFPGMYIDVSELKLNEKLGIALQMVDDGCPKPYQHLIDVVKNAYYLGWDEESGEMVTTPASKRFPPAVMLYLIADNYDKEVREMLDERKEMIADKISEDQRDYKKIAYTLSAYRDNTEEYQNALEALKQLDQ